MFVKNRGDTMSELSQVDLDVLKGKFLWIWQVENCDKGDLGKIIQRARDLNLKGYIVKTDNGASHNYRNQMRAVSEFRKAGLIVGGWNYLYGTNVNGEVTAVLETIRKGIDFYVLNVEDPYEGQHQKAIQLMTGIRGQITQNIPIGYCTFALPSYHRSFPYREFSDFCDFTMPMTYWNGMRRPIQELFFDCMRQYRPFDLPVYPVGQCYDAPDGKWKTTYDEIIAFEKLCRDQGVPLTSYWSYQHATPVHFEALKVHFDTRPSPGDPGAPRGSGGGDTMVYNANVEQQQRRLQTAGYDPGPIDGLLGPRTMAAFNLAMDDLKNANDRIAAVQNQLEDIKKIREEDLSLYRLFNKKLEEVRKL